MATVPTTQAPSQTPNNSLTLQLNPFAAISGAVSTETLPAIMPLRLAIAGLPGVGKSWLASTAPKPIMYYDFDNRAASLRGKPGIMIKTLVDTNPMQPQSIITLENDLAMLKSAKQSGKPIPATFVLDSATYLRKCMENSLMSQEKDMGKSFRITPNKTLRSASALTTANVIRNFFEYFINEFGALGNIIVVFHTKDQIDRDKTTKENTVYTGKFTTEPQYMETVLSIFNERWRLDKDYTNKYVVYTKDDPNFASITSLNIDAQETSNIEAILKKHEDRVKGAK